MIFSYHDINFLDFAVTLLRILILKCYYVFILLSHGALIFFFFEFK